jgi:hypothetical protein
MRAFSTMDVPVIWFLSVYGGVRAQGDNRPGSRGFRIDAEPIAKIAPAAVVDQASFEQPERENPEAGAHLLEPRHSVDPPCQRRPRSSPTRFAIEAVNWQHRGAGRLDKPAQLHRLAPLVRRDKIRTRARMPQPKAMPEQDLPKHLPLPATSTEIVNALAHFHRAEMGRMSDWRGRIDRTSNWAITVVAGMLSISLSTPSSHHGVLLFAMLLVVAVSSMLAANLPIAALAATVPIKVHTERYNLADANRALTDLRAGPRKKGGSRATGDACPDD